MVKSTDHSPDILKNIKGASERDIAMSALEEIMCSTVAEQWEISAKYDRNMRTAAYVTAIERVAKTYEQTGLLI